MPTVTCGWLYHCDVTRVCVKKRGHKGTHSDALAQKKLKESRRKWREANQGKFKQSKQEADRKYRQANVELYYAASYRRRAAKQSAPHVNWTKSMLLSLYGSHCWLCGTELGDTWHADHVIPLSRWKGWDMPLNLRPTCPTCNLHKQARLVNCPLTADLLKLMWFVQYVVRLHVLRCSLQ